MVIDRFGFDFSKIDTSKKSDLSVNALRPGNETLSLSEAHSLSFAPDTGYQTKEIFKAIAVQFSER